MSRIFIGGLPEDASRTELEREFEYFGRLRDVWVARNPPGFGFIVFEDARDAEDAIREMDGKRICGTRIRVEPARGPLRGGHGAAGGRRGEKCNNCGRFGHSTRECRSGRGGGAAARRRSRTRSRSRSRERRDNRRSRSRSRSGSKERTSNNPRSRSRSRSESRDKERRRSPSRSRSREQKSAERKKSQSRSRSRSPSRSRSRSPAPAENGGDKIDQESHGDDGDNAGDRRDDD